MYDHRFGHKKNLTRIRLLDGNQKPPVRQWGTGFSVRHGVCDTIRADADHGRGVVVAKAGRNEPCPCGSGRKTKRCCGTSTGPSADQQARGWLNAQARDWAPLLVDCNNTDLDELLSKVTHLPLLDLSLQLPLPRLLPPPLERLRRAAQSQDPEAIADAATQALPSVDTPSMRAHLARAVLALHDDDHHIDCDVTAYAILDLAENKPPALLFAALVQTFAVTAGTARTPAGLLLASR